MALTNYPNGFVGGVVLRGVPLAQTHPGRAFWVSNNTTGLLAGQKGGSDGNRGDFNAPFATLSYALTQCVANRGDIVFIKPGHTETVSSAGAIALATAGVAIVGLGFGSSRPTFTLDTANTATIAVSADNVSVQNCLFVANFLSIATCFALTTAKGFTVQACEFRDTSGVLNFLNCVKSTGAANTVDGLTVTDSAWYGLGTTSVGSFILTANDIDRLTIQRNTVILKTTVDAPIFVNVTAGVLTNLYADSNNGYRLNTATTGGSLTNVGGTTSTGIVSSNYVQTKTTTSDLLFTTSVGLAAFENRVSGVTGATGFVIPSADS